jgi:hypothetical protein
MCAKEKEYNNVQFFNLVLKRTDHSFFNGRKQTTNCFRSHKKRNVEITSNDTTVSVVFAAKQLTYCM